MGVGVGVEEVLGVPPPERVACCVLLGVLGSAAARQKLAAARQGSLGDRKISH